MKKRRGFCFKWLGIFLMLLFGLTAGGKTAEAAGYSQDYRYWSQGVFGLYSNAAGGLFDYSAGKDALRSKCKPKRGF